ncbi:MAG: Txe/YoeB family addiction module toxin [Treponema sp.]|nr:Txe/YoeB family addiction module toxin [Treponema sp.]
MIISFTPTAFEDYQYWATNEKSVFKKTNALIKEIMRMPFTGTGKPEPLKHELAGYWSRRITEEHRLVYKVEQDTILIVSCRYHY